MSGLARRLMAGADAVDKLYVDDVFSAYTYTGNGSPQTINNGIDLAGKGGMVWVQYRSGTNHGVAYPSLMDSARSPENILSSSRNAAQGAYHYIPPNGFLTTGFKWQGNYASDANDSMISWTFRKSPKFFDVVTFTATRSGSGWSGGPRVISHSLGVQPGMVVWKAVDQTSNWYVNHISQGANKRLFLNTTDAVVDTGAAYLTTSASNITFENATCGLVADGVTVTLVAYLFAHDPSADGIIQCGSYEATGASNTIELGWEPQFMLWRPANQVESWRLLDTSRGWTVGGSDANLYANSSAAEASNDLGYPTATGAVIKNIYISGTYIYIAIRRSNKPPTTGTEVYNAIARTGTGAAATVTGVGFSPDLLIARRRNSAAAPRWYDQNRGVGNVLISAESSVESLDTSNAPGSFDADGMTLITGSTLNQTSMPYINHFFRRAPGFFDVVCYKGNDSFAPRQHNLGVTPELSISKKRAGAGVANNWWVLTPTKYGYLDAASALTNFSFSMGSASQFNPALDSSNTEYIAYLFATLPGISKVGTYTGNGSSQTINCGFTTGARFVLIKHADSIGDWYIWDTVRGIIAANDPHLSLNSTAAEVTTDDSIDPDVSGFIVNQNTATNINVLGASYIFLAIA